MKKVVFMLETTFVLFAILTRNSMTGTSVSTPTVVASAAGEVVPSRATATAFVRDENIPATFRKRESCRDMFRLAY